MVVQLSIAVQIKVVDEENEILRRHFSVAIFPFELAKLLGSDEPCGIPINSLEGGIRLKISDCGQYLTHFFDGQLLISDEEEQLLKFEF